MPPPPPPSSATAANIASAYGGMLKARILSIFIIGGMFYLLRNVLFKDYTYTTREYLTKTGHADDIDRVLPTKGRAQPLDPRSQLLREQGVLDYNEALTNISILSAQMNDMQHRIDELTQQVSEIKLKRDSPAMNTLKSADTFETAFATKNSSSMLSRKNKRRPR